MRHAQFLPTDHPLAIKADVLGTLFMIMPQGGEPFTLEGPAAVVDVRGPVVQHKSPIWDSYDAIAERVAAAAASSAQAVVLRIDSPGGDALGVMECARELRATCRTARKRLFAFADGMVCSAAYALATSADTIITPPAGVVGSVGVFQPLIDATAADRAMGLTYEMISSGERKLDGNPHTKITDAARAETQRRVDGLAELFFALVAEMRPGVNAAAMRGLEGGIFLGAEAVNVGLADVVGSWSDVLALAGNQQAAASAKATETKMDPEKKAKARKAFLSAIDAAFDAAFGDEDGGGGGSEDDKKKKDEEAKASAAAAKAEDDKKKEECAAAAKAEEEKKKEEAKALAAKAATGDVAAVMAIALKAQEEVATLRAEGAAKDEKIARAALLARRPDFTADQLELLALVPLAEVEKAVAKWPRIGPVKLAAVPQPQATRGERQTSEEVPSLDPALAQRIKERMGTTTPKAAVSTYEGGVQTLEFCTPDQAKARLEQIAKEGVK